MQRLRFNDFFMFPPIEFSGSAIETREPSIQIFYVRVLTYITVSAVTSKTTGSV